MEPLVPLPPQPSGVPWPTATWPTGPADPSVTALVDRAFEDEVLSESYAVVVVRGGRLVAERYGGLFEHRDRPPDPVGPGSRLMSWSVAKSMLHAAVGILVGEGRLAPDAPAEVPEWRGADDPRGRITLEHLLEMRDGLDFTEEYVDASVSDVIDMLFHAGKQDTARFAADQELAAPPGERFNYSSGTANIVSGIVARLVGPGEPYSAWLADRLFGPVGMTSARPRFDAAGTWIASSYVHATAQDYARFGLLYLRDGVWDGRRLLPEGWVDHGRLARSVHPDDGRLYGAHWWVVGDRHGSFWASGYLGQSVLVSPGLDLVVVRLGKTPAERSDALTAWRAEVVEAVAKT